MSCRRNCKLMVLAALLYSVLLPTAVSAQGDPLALQRNAIQRMDAFWRRGSPAIVEMRLQQPDDLRLC